MDQCVQREVDDARPLTGAIVPDQLWKFKFDSPGSEKSLRISWRYARMQLRSIGT